RRRHTRFSRDWSSDVCSSDLSYFECWCKERGHHPCPARPETVASYIAHLARSGYKPSTIRRRITSINQVHNLHGYEKPSGHALRSEERRVGKESRSRCWLEGW